MKDKMALFDSGSKSGKFADELEELSCTIQDADSSSGFTVNYLCLLLTC